MLFEDDFIKKVEEDPISGVVDACKLTRDRLFEARTDEHGWNEDEHEILWEAASFLEIVIEANNLAVEATIPSPQGDIDGDCKILMFYLSQIQSTFEAKSLELKVEAYKNRYKAALKTSFAYEFSQGDLQRIQNLVNELREQIARNQQLDSDHQRRLLKRLEGLQSELHKRVSDLDRFWGMVGDAGVVLGKLGTDAKPIVDRIKEIAEIVWKTQARTEELPSDAPYPLIERDDNT